MPHDMLTEMFALQAELNKRIGYDTKSLHDRFDPLAAGRWLNDYIIAAGNELEELRDCTFWKHWCAEAKRGERFAIHDLQNARVEVIDILFFWISMAQCVGLSAEDAHHLYMQKLDVNHKRQDRAYSMKGKTEEDNKAIVVKRAIKRGNAETRKRGNEENVATAKRSRRSQAAGAQPPRRRAK